MKAVYEDKLVSMATCEVNGSKYGKKPEKHENITAHSQPQSHNEWNVLMQSSYSNEGSLFFRNQTHGQVGTWN